MGETLNLWQLLSFVVVILGLLLIKYSQDFKLGQLKGIQWGLLTMLFFGLTDLSSKQATLLGASTLPVLAVMYGTGATLFGTQWAINRLKASRHTVRIAAAEVEGSVLDADTAPETVVVPVQWSNGKTLGWGMFVGISNIAGMVFLIPAFREGVTGIVSAISAMNVVFVLLYARFYLKSHVPSRDHGVISCLGRNCATSIAGVEKNRKLDTVLSVSLSVFFNISSKLTLVPLGFPVHVALFSVSYRRRSSEGPG